MLVTGTTSFAIAYGKSSKATAKTVALSKCQRTMGHDRVAIVFSMVKGVRIIVFAVYKRFVYNDANRYSQGYIYQQNIRAGDVPGTHVVFIGVCRELWNVGKVKEFSWIQETKCASRGCLMNKSTCAATFPKRQWAVDNITQVGLEIRLLG